MVLTARLCTARGERRRRSDILPPSITIGNGVHAEACLHPSCPSSFPVLPHLSSIRADLRCDTAGLCLHSWITVDCVHVHAEDSRPLAVEYVWAAIIYCAPPPRCLADTRWCSPFGTGINQNTPFFSLYFRCVPAPNDAL